MMLSQTKKPSSYKLSVVIATKNRPKEIMACIQALSKNSYKNFEIIIVDQSKNPVHIASKKRPGMPKMRHVFYPQGGKTSALNHALPLAQGEILAFTDDDCVPPSNWLETIVSSMTKHTDCDAFFGDVFPYKPKKHPGLICPSVISAPKKEISSPTVHFQTIGFGNNFAIRRSIAQTHKFKVWLGPGSIGCNAEDAEFSLRLLLNKYTILHDPEIKIFHNRWLTKKQMRKQTLIYTCGEMACYGYYALQGHTFALSVLIASATDTLKEMKKSHDLLYSFSLMYYSARGFFVAVWFAFTDPLGSITR